MDEFPDLTIGEVAKRAGVASSTIRYYERIGLLPAPQRLHGQRRYATDALDRLRFIGVAQSAGFKLGEIKELVNGVETASSMGELVRVISSQKLEEVNALLERANAMKGWLEVATDCGCASPSECTLFDGPETQRADGVSALPLVRVEGTGCRRQATTTSRRAG